MREVSFRIADVIDEYLRLIHRTDPGCRSLVCKIPSLIKTLIPRHKIASEIQDIKLSIRGIKERSERYNFQISHEQGSSRSSNGTGETENGRWRHPRLSSLFVDETEIVGFEGPREELFGWLLEGAAECTVISVVSCFCHFQKFKELILSNLNRVNSIRVEKGVLLSLERLQMEKIPRLKKVPSGIKHLNKLKVIDLVDMPDEFVKSIDPEDTATGLSSMCLLY
ncbi:disease resistance protein RPM1 [Trifolium repens]|nr:disease resistance protein RPM1 [Trifolium repens]